MTNSASTPSNSDTRRDAVMGGICGDGPLLCDDCSVPAHELTQFPGCGRVITSPDSEQGLWFADRGNFWGTINQMCLCAKCGKAERKGPNEPTHYSGIFTPHVHFLCDDCYENLPNKGGSQ